MRDRGVHAWCFQIVHTGVADYYGGANKNMGSAFLLVRADANKPREHHRTAVCLHCGVRVCVRVIDAEVSGRVRG